MRDHYQVLQVDPRADADVIRAAYRVLARKYHPDHGGDAPRMIALNDAWDVLGDPDRRSQYDAARALAAAEGRRGAAAASPWRSPAGDAAGAGAAAGPNGAGPAPRAGSAWSSDGGIPRKGPPPGNPSGTVLNFGQYAGWSLGEIARHDVGYLEWLQRSPSGRPLRAEIDALLRRRQPAPPPPPKRRFGR